MFLEKYARRRKIEDKKLKKVILDEKAMKNLPRRKVMHEKKKIRQSKWCHNTISSTTKPIRRVMQPKKKK